jgi:hypothetical protein
VELIRLVKPDEWNKALIHPEYGKEMDLWYLLGYYAWHGRHHTAQINKFRERMGW